MRPIRPLRTDVTLRFSEEMQELARRIAEADGIVPLKPGEHRPPGYYRIGFFTRGRKPLPPRKTGTPPDER
jgi:hypothetical protein